MGSFFGVRHTFKHLAQCDADPYCPEIKAWNARRLDAVWENVSNGEQSQATIPFWAIVWPGARALARYILDHPEEFEGKRVLDAACGSGFASIATALVGATVLAIDLDPLATEAAALTAALNRVNFPIETGDAFNEDIVNRFSPDIIICGDVFYEPGLAEVATGFLENSAGRGIRVLAADPGRFHRPAGVFTILEKVRIPVLPDVEGIKWRDTFLLTLPGSSLGAKNS